MRVRAKYNLFHDGKFHRTGEAFEISATEAEDIAPYVELDETPVDEAAVEEAPKRGRKRKAE